MNRTVFRVPLMCRDRNMYRALLALTHRRLALFVMDRCWLLALLAAAWLAADLVQAQDKSRRAERRARRSQQSAQTDADRDTAAVTPGQSNPKLADAEPQKSDDNQS